jgi:FKBP-type peptidyl-prolyl cis-trans isomerase FkpA
MKVHNLKRILLTALAAATLPAPLAAQDGDVFASVEEPAKPDPSQSAHWHNRQMLALAELRWQDGWRTLPGNLRWRPISGDGSGAHPSVRDVITLHYEGRLVNGMVFDSSFERGQPATFPLNRLIPGWQLAVPEMGVGDTIEIAVPSDFGYGPEGTGPIPGGATLFFKIELLAIRGAN